nr:MAG TPA: hypothetical protein [Caudoviricetes sp.]
MSKSHKNGDNSRLFGVFAEPENPCTKSTLGFSEPTKNPTRGPQKILVLLGL